MKLLASLALLALASNHVSAYCPNLCSGHGTCENQDTCACYKYVGTSRGDFDSAYNNLRVAWTGADCSLRTCPVAYSWSGATPNGLSSWANLKAEISGGNTVTALQIDVDSLDGDNESFKVGSKIRIVEDSEASSLLTIRSASYSNDHIAVVTYEPITVSYSTSAKVYYAPSEKEISGSPLDAKDANGAHSMLECSGQGICDRSTGNCECFPGYEGEACTRSACPNDCSGNGICLSAKRLASDNSENYQYAWDSEKHFGCFCDVGFRGPDCSLQECPSNYDPMFGCGGGVCNTGSTYTAADNTTPNCPNFNNSDCTSEEQRDCSGRGICDYESGTCKCFSGFFGQACETQTILI